MPAPDLSALDPDPDALLDWLRRQVDEATLVEIAQADYGMEFSENLACLRAVRDTGRVPVPMGWPPCEVLALVRWREPDDDAGHVERAFACAVLLRGAADPGNQSRDPLATPDTVAQLLASVAALGPKAEQAALRFFAWLAPRLPEAHHHPGYLALAVGLLAAAVDPPPADDRLQELGWWVIETVESERSGWYGEAYTGLRYEAWQRLAVRMRERVERLPPGDGREVLREVAGLITV